MTAIGVVRPADTTVGHVPIARLQQWMELVLCAAGLAASDGQAVARNLAEAEKRNVRSHGLLLLPVYQQRIAAGGIRSSYRMSCVADLGSRAVWDGDGGPGQAIAFRAVRDAMSRAEQFGIGCSLVRNGNHVGMLASYGEEAARHGYVALVMTNTGASMKSPAGDVPSIGNNALCFSAPLEGEPFVFDMATGVVSCGKIRLASLHGQSPPLNCGVSAGGIDAGEAVLPAGGFKGFGLAMMADILCAFMADGHASSGVRRQRMALAAVTGACQSFTVWSLGGLTDRNTFESSLRQYLDDLRSKNADRIVPGDPEQRAAASAGTHGIALTAPITTLIDEVAARAGVEPLRFDPA